jgi:hypothetical protein
MGAIKRLHKARVRQCATLFLVTGSNLGCGERGRGPPLTLKLDALVGASTQRGLNVQSTL